MKAHLARDGKASTGKLLLAACLAGGLGGLAGNPAGACDYSYFVKTLK